MKKNLFITLIGLLLLNSIVFAQNLSDFSVDLNKAGNGVIINKYRGGTTDVVVPSIIEGYPVVELADECFKGTKITSVKLPNSIIKIGEDCFMNCGSLKNINIPDTLIYLGASAFQNTSSLDSIIIPESIKTFGNDLKEFKDWAGLFDRSGIKKIVFSGYREILSASIFNGLHDIYTVGRNTLYTGKSWNSSVEEIILPNGLKKIDSNSFYEMGKLKIVTIPNTVTEIGENAFYGCSELTTVSIPPSVIEIGESAFQYCDNLKTIIIPSSVKKIGIAVFADCKNLTSITLPNGITEISRSLFNRSGLTTIVIPSTVETIGIWAFQETELTEITFPSGLKEILGGAFYNCSKLRTLIFPESMSSLVFGTFDANRQTYFAFGKCDYLTITAKARLKNLGYTE